MLRSLLAVALGCATATAQVTYYSAYLDPAQEVPATASTGHGWGVVRFDAGTSSVQLFCYHTGLTSPAIAAHIHQAAVGANGPVIVGMSLIAPNTWSGAGALTPAQVTALQTNGMYLNVHTSTFPGGEVRGQVVLSKSTRFTGVLSGAQEVPPTGSAATGTAVAFLHEPDNRLVYVVNSTGLVNVIAAHFHQAAAGVNGPVIVNFNGGGGTYCGVSDRLTPAQLAALMADGFYANIHTSTFPGGEIRAQMRKDVGDHFYAICNGAAETPPVPSLGLGSAALILQPNGQLVLNGAFGGLGSAAVAAHVHRGAVGVAGPIVFGLTFAGGVLSGTYTPTVADLADLRSGQWYVNVHSAVFGGGEIRGQLLPATLPSTYGEGCLSSSGFIPHAGVTGFPCLGSSFTFDLYGAPAPTFALLFVGDNRDPGPVELPLLGIGAPGCHALLTSIVLQFTQITNAQGCASQPIAVPLDPNLRNVPLVAQWVALDALANPAQLVTSNALSFVVP